ncbi:MAG: sigma-70 family RNA polymerase sigma factor [bacterium]
MDISNLYIAALKGDKSAERILFQYLFETFTLLVEHKIQDLNDRQDMVQEVMTVISEKYKTVTITTNIAAWAYGIFENNLKRYYRDKNRKSRLFKEYLSTTTKISPEPTDYELRNKIIKCLKKICKENLRYAEALNLVHQGYNTVEISEKMNISKKNVHNILFRARSMLKQCINESENLIK